MTKRKLLDRPSGKEQNDTEMNAESKIKDARKHQQQINDVPETVKVFEAVVDETLYDVDNEHGCEDEEDDVETQCCHTTNRIKLMQGECSDWMGNEYAANTRHLGSNDNLRQLR